MKTKRTIELTVEHSEFSLRRIARRSVFAWCDECGCQKQMVKVDEAAQYAGISPRAIYRRVETGQIHFLEAPDGALLICLDSVMTKLGEVG